MTALPSAPELSLLVRTRDAATPAVVGASGIAGMAAAVAIPLDRPGVGWLVAGLAITAAVVVVRRHTWRGGVPSISRQLWVIGALAVLSVGAVRASEWLFVLCVLTAGAAGSLAVSNGRSVRGVLVGMAALPFASIRALPWAARGVAALRTRISTSSIRLAGSVAVAGLLALVFGALFAGADAAFANLLDAAIPSPDGGSVAR